jgi:hypothetical protein
MDINLEGAFLFSKAVLPFMVQNGDLYSANPFLAL